MDAVMAEDAQKAAKLESLRVNAASWREKMKEDGMSIGEHKTECCEPGGAEPWTAATLPSIDWEYIRRGGAPSGGARGSGASAAVASRGEDDEDEDEEAEDEERETDESFEAVVGRVELNSSTTLQCEVLRTVSAMGCV